MTRTRYLHSLIHALGQAYEDLVMLVAWQKAAYALPWTTLVLETKSIVIASNAWIMRMRLREGGDKNSKQHLLMAFLVKLV
jgi:hypothetical protein